VKVSMVSIAALFLARTIKGFARVGYRACKSNITALTSTLSSKNVLGACLEKMAVPCSLSTRGLRIDRAYPSTPESHPQAGTKPNKLCLSPR